MRLKFSEKKISAICIDVIQLSDGEDYNKRFDVLLSLKYKKN